jgi:hypothetical protein
VGKWKEAEGAAFPRGWDVQVGKAAVDEAGVVAAQVKRAGLLVVGDVQGAGGVQEVPPELVPGVAVW